MNRELADKAYSSRSNRIWLRHRGIEATIRCRPVGPATDSPAGSAGGRPSAFDPVIYRDRSIVELGGPVTIFDGRRIAGDGDRPQRRTASAAL